MICKVCGVWYDPIRGCDHRILTMKDTKSDYDI